MESPEMEPEHSRRYRHTALANIGSRIFTASGGGHTVNASGGGHCELL